MSKAPRKSPNQALRQASLNIAGQVEDTQAAQAQAILALAYEQRTANMIAYANMNTDRDPWLVMEVRNRIWSTEEEEE